MKVKTLVKKLLDMPPEAKVKIIYDGEPRLDASVVYLARNGKIMITGYNQSVYSRSARPETANDENVWSTPNEPKK